MEKLSISENLIISASGDEVAVKAIIIDQEGDEIECHFRYDNGVEINSENLSYISFSRQNLVDLIKLIDDSEKFYDTHYKKENSKI